MKRWIKLSLPILLVVISIIAFVLLVSGRPAPERREPPQTALLVDTIAAEVSNQRFEVASQGTVRPRTRTTLVAEVSGSIVEISDNFVAGGFFEAGEVLARIDPSDYESELLRARAELASAKARLSDEESRSEQARRDWVRMHGESGREPSPLVLRLPQVQEARASVQAAEAAVQRAQRNLERTRIRLPYDGLVRERNADLGQYVNTGTNLGVAFAIDVAEVRLPLTDRDLAFVDLPRPGFEPDTPVPVRLTARPGGQAAAWDAEIIRTEAVVEEATRLIHAVAHVRDPYALSEGSDHTPLQMGTFVNARIQGRSAAGLIALPRAAVREDGRVLIADADDKLAMREVHIVRSTPETVYVTNSLYAGDRVITTAVPAPVPGLSLRVREAAENTDGPDEPVLRILGTDPSFDDADETEQ
jgi:RND family efflux transporter MFP subunit